jgi:hypothetical protein
MKRRDFISMRHETEQSVDQPLQLERVDDHLPVDFDLLRIEARRGVSADGTARDRLGSVYDTLRP